MTDGRIQPIRPYRKRSPDTVKFAGFRLTPHCAEQLSELAAAKRIAPSAAITEVLEEWHRVELNRKHRATSEGDATSGRLRARVDLVGNLRRR